MDDSEVPTNNANCFNYSSGAGGTTAGASAAASIHRNGHSNFLLCRLFLVLLLTVTMMVTILPTPITFPITSPSTTRTTTPLFCTHVSYQLTHLNATATNKLLLGTRTHARHSLAAALELAVASIVQDFCRNFTGQLFYADSHPATVTGAVEVPPVLCPALHCVVVTQTACVVLEWHNPTTTNNNNSSAMVTTVQAGLRNTLRDAISSKTMLDKIPPEYL